MEREQQPPADTQENNHTEKKKKGLGKGAKITLLVLAALLLAGGGILAKFLRDIRNPAEMFPAPAPPEQAPFTPAPAPSALPLAQPLEATPSPTPDPGAALLQAADLEFMKNRVNILILGLDESTEREHWGSFRTDTMILVTINFETNDVHMISIPRDSYVKICNGSANPTGKLGRINSAFPSGGGAQKNGFDYAMGTVSYLLGGVPVSYYVGFNMNVVKQVVDAMGGVDYDVDTYVYMNGRELFEGPQHLDGQAVLDYCRLRKGSSDIARIDRQQRMLTEILRQLKNTGQIANIPSIYQAVEQNIQTNLSFKQISALALLAYEMDIAQLARTTLPGSGLMIGKRSCIAVSPSKIEVLVKDIFGVKVAVDSSISADAIRARIEENRAAIAGELSAANSALRTADHILSQYESLLDSSERSALKSARGRLEDAIEEEDGDLLRAYTPPVSQLNSQLLSRLGQSAPALPGEDPAIDPSGEYVPEETPAPTPRYAPSMSDSAAG